jgi:hypothetical protein
MRGGDAHLIISVFASYVPKARFPATFEESGLLGILAKQAGWVQMIKTRGGIWTAFSSLGISLGEISVCLNRNLDLHVFWLSS